MDLELLEEIGLTEGERKVYKALVLLGKSSTGPIAEESGVSTSKVYPILDSLMERGLASYIVENNVRRYSPTDPENLIDYINKKEERLERIKDKTTDLVKEIKGELGSFEEETAKLYKGFRSLKSALNSLLESLKGTEKDYLHFAPPPERFTEEIEFFMDKWHQRRVKAGIKVRGIVPSKHKEDYIRLNESRDNYELRSIDPETTPNTIHVGGGRIFIGSLEGDSIGVEIISSKMERDYRNFFEDLWKQAESL